MDDNPISDKETENVDAVVKETTKNVEATTEAETNQVSSKEPKIVQTDKNSKNGQSKCPQCGSTDISLNVKTGMLRCNFCRHEFSPEELEGLEKDITKLEGEVMASGTKDIAADAKDVMTFKCSSCGAEVVIDTSESTQARCHWCRNMLSINQQVPNGAVPDVVLPFNITKDEAKDEIKKFVGKRKFFAHPKFVKEFTTDNVMGVYFPYMVVDVNSHATFVGQGEHEVRRYTVGTSADNRTTYYDADLYDVERDFDLTIEGLTVESSSDKLNKATSDKTNNIINAIMPFDIEKSVKYDSNYLKGYSSEKRDTNVEMLRTLVDTQSKDIARFAANETLKHYDRGVCWSKQELDVKGKQWKSAYLPVWLYSYQQIKKNGKKLLHYVAVNARTKETMGSVPIHMPKLLGVSGIIELIGLVAMLFARDFEYRWIFLLAGIIFFAFMYLRYRNSNARHKHETETKKKMFNLVKKDDLIKRERRLTNSQIVGANNTVVYGQGAFGGKSVFENIKDAIK